MEEILESIKKVIARDNRVGAAEERRMREVEGMPKSPAVAPQDEEQDDVLDLAESTQIDEAGTTTTAQGPMVTEHARSSMRDSLAALALLAEPGAPPKIVRSGETSLEGMVRDLLRPALSEWLDKNLPPLVERMVAAEIARIVGKKG